MKEIRLTKQEIQSVISSKQSLEIDENKQILSFLNEDNSHCELILPLAFPKIYNKSTTDILKQINEVTYSYIIILIQAGSAALGYWHKGELLNHKVIKKYMVRKKQGKSQLKYLKSKGKSRVGSRIRLQNSILFFEDINKTLTKWNVSKNSESILVFVPINLKSLWFSSNISVPFSKKDHRVKKIPVDIKVPSFKELMHINWIITKGTLVQQ